MSTRAQSFAALAELIQETGAQAVFFNHLYDPVSLVRDGSACACTFFR